MGQEILKAALIDLDATYLIQIGVFLILYILLSQLFFKPYVALLKARDEATEGLKQKAQTLIEEAIKAEKMAEEQVSKAKAEAIIIRRKLVEEGTRMRDEILNRERARIEAEVAKGIDEINRIKAEILGRVDIYASDLAMLIEEQIKRPEREN